MPPARKCECGECDRCKHREYMRSYYHAHSGKYGSGGPVELKCEFCGTTFQTTMRKATNQARRFCSRQCKENARSARKRQLTALRDPDHFVRQKDMNLRRYGLDIEKYGLLLYEQEGKCKICGDEPKDGELLHVDHHHGTGEIRGLLCNTCNRFIGLAQDSAAVLRAAADYLEL